VSFVNTLPLIDGLNSLADVQLRQSVPSLLLDQLMADEVDIALCSSIDYQRSPELLVILPVGLLGCDGPTLTVRLFSSRPLKAITQVYCDTDSHTSIALIKILLRELHGVDPQLIDYDAREHVARNKPVDWPETVLLIGDKVVTNATPAIRYPHQMDLGAAWVELTGLPFVFALWMAKASACSETLATASMILDHQRRHNIDRVDGMIHRHAKPRQWPGDLAAEYLKEKIAYEFTPQRRAGLELFFQKAKSQGLIEQVRPIEVVM
jgi:chorismate dehydratase